MLRKIACLAAVAGAFISTPTYAAEHNILVLPTAYFPQTSYVSAGDTLEFANSSLETITVTSVDGEWTTGPLGPDQSATIVVTAGMSRDFIHEGVTDENGDPAVTGIIEFGSAPLK